MSSDDLIEWPDGTWCWRCDLETMRHMSDDYVIHLFESPEWRALAEKEDL